MVHLSNHLAFYSISIVLTLALATCSSLNTKEEDEYVENRARARELQDEISIGRSMAAKLLGVFGAYQNDQVLNSYINRVGRNLATKVGRPDLTYYFAVLDTEEVNAFATPGGYVFITTGYLRQITNESQLAAVLAHEIAHINERHMYYYLRPKRKAGVENTVARFIARGQSELGKSITQAVGKGLEKLLKKGMEESVEREADEAGMIYTVQAGYDPQEYVKLMYALHRNRKKLRMVGSAANLQVRAKFLKSTLTESGLSKKTDTRFGVLTARYKRAIAQLKLKK